MFSVIIPTHNEESRIAATLKELLAFLKGKYPGKFEIIIVDDGLDGTVGAVKRFSQKKENRISIMHFPKRLGKGGALVRGMARARGSELIIYDADAATPPKEIPRMLTGLKRAELVIGSRAMEGSKVLSETPRRRKAASKAFNILVNALFGFHIRDTQCGFKGIRRAAAKKLLPSLRLTGFEWDVELIVRAVRAGYKVEEMPIEWKNKKEGKVNPRDTIEMLKGIVSLKRELG